MPKALAVLLLALAASGIAYAGAGQCDNPTWKTTKITDAGADKVPATNAASRVSIMVCNGAENATSTIIKCAARLGDGGLAVGAANPGDALNVGDCIPYPLDYTVQLWCTGTVGAYVSTLECL
jgi:hypothetical protein